MPIFDTIVFGEDAIFIYVNKEKMFWTVFSAVLAALFFYSAITNASKLEWDILWIFVFKNLIAIIVFIILFSALSYNFGFIELIFSLVVAFVFQYGIKLIFRLLIKILPTIFVFYEKVDSLFSKKFSIDFIIPKKIRNYLHKMEKKGGLGIAMSGVIKHCILFIFFFIFLFVVLTLELIILYTFD